MLFSLHAIGQSNKLIGLSLNSADNYIVKQTDSLIRGHFFILKLYGSSNKIKLLSSLYLQNDTIWVRKFFLDSSEKIIEEVTDSIPGRENVNKFNRFISLFPNMADNKCKHYIYHLISKRHLIKISKNEWHITSWKHDLTNPFPNLDGIAFKHRLVRLRCGCGGIFKNLRDRKRVKNLLEDLGFDIHYQIPNN